MEQLDLREISNKERIEKIETMLYDRSFFVEGEEQDVLEYARNLGCTDIIHLTGHEKSHIKGGGYEEYILRLTPEQRKINDLDENVTVVTLYDNIVEKISVSPDKAAEHISDILYRECHCLYCVLTFAEPRKVLYEFR